jgi:hypothetical protein
LHGRVGHATDAALIGQHESHWKEAANEVEITIGQILSVGSGVAIY